MVERIQRLADSRNLGGWWRPSGSHLLILEKPPRIPQYKLLWTFVFSSTMSEQIFAGLAGGYTIVFDIVSQQRKRPREGGQRSWLDSCLPLEVPE